MHSQELGMEELLSLCIKSLRRLIQFTGAKEHPKLHPILYNVL